VISIETKNAEEVRAILKKKFKLTSTLVDDTVRVEKRNGHQFVPKIIEAFPGKIRAISVGTPTLEDVSFIAPGTGCITKAPMKKRTKSDSRKLP